MSAHATTTEQLDDPEMGATWFYSFVGIIFFVAFCLAVSVMFFGVQRDFEEEHQCDRHAHRRGDEHAPLPRGERPVGRRIAGGTRGRVAHGLHRGDRPSGPAR